MAIQQVEIKYTSRGFHQDANSAMRGQIVRGLIETITNSDDAYPESSKGKIRIEVDRSKARKVITRDLAGGMTAAELKSNILDVAARTSGFEEGKRVRGNLGRGALDLLAFGPVDFECIKDGMYTKLSLDVNGEGKLHEVKATNAHRNRLSIKGNRSGTVVTIHVRTGITIPRHANLKDQLSQHVQLRDILSDPNRNVTLVETSSDGREETLRYVYPDLLLVYDESVEITGYPGVSAQLIIKRNTERYDHARSDTGRPSGLLIKGNRAIYESSLFKYEGNAYSGWFSGEIHCPHIDKIARDYDDRFDAGKNPTKLNPTPIVSRIRDGLDPQHPFYRALASAAEPRLLELIEVEEKKARSRSDFETPALRQSLNTLGKDLAQLIDEDIRELDEEPGMEGSVEGEANPITLRLSPEHVVVYMGEEKTISVIANKSLAGSTFEVSMEPEGVIDLGIDSLPLLTPHQKNPELLSSQIHLRPIAPHEETLVTVRAGRHEAVGIVEVRAEREIVQMEPPAGLQFERKNYRLKIGQSVSWCWRLRWI